MPLFTELIPTGEDDPETRAIFFPDKEYGPTIPGPLIINPNLSL